MRRERIPGHSMRTCVITKFAPSLSLLEQGGAVFPVATSYPETFYLILSRHLYFPFTKFEQGIS